MDFDEASYKAILEVMDDKADEIVSSALITHEIETDDSYPAIPSTRIDESIQDLITFGELTLVWVQQAARVILTRSVPPGTDRQATLVNGTWKCYIAPDHRERYHSGLFESKQAAIEYLHQVVGDDIGVLEPVPACNMVFATETHGFEGYGTHTVVVRGERIHHQFSLEE